MRAKEFVQRSVRENRTVNIPISITIPTDEEEPVIIQQTDVISQDSANVEPNVPINARLSKVGPTDTLSIEEPEVQDNLPDEENGDPEADKMIPPLQQELELTKADAGADSEVIDQITNDDETEEEKILPLSYR